VVLLVLGSRVTHSILAPGKHEILALITGDKSDFEVGYTTGIDFY
jgi:hypothetical protein